MLTFGCAAGLAWSHVEPPLRGHVLELLLAVGMVRCPRMLLLLLLLSAAKSCIVYMSSRDQGLLYRYRLTLTIT